jgi:hypothetical protein
VDPLNRAGAQLRASSWRFAAAVLEAPGSERSSAVLGDWVVTKVEGLEGALTKWPLPPVEPVSD